MKLRIKRVILFVNDVQAMTAFYSTVLGLHIKTDPRDPEWVELDAGSCALALHRNRGAKQANKTTKIVFGVADVEAIRDELNKRGARLGPIRIFEGLHISDGKDPEGNIFQISNRP